MRKNFLNDLVFRTRLIGFEYHLDSKRELMQGKSVFGYKVFGPGWLCENSSLRDVDSRDGEIIVYGFGMDFYKSLTEFRQDAGKNTAQAGRCRSVGSICFAGGEPTGGVSAYTSL